MRILYVITKANYGGAQKYVFELATAAATAGHEVMVAYGETGLLKEKLSEKGVRTIPIRGLERNIGLFKEWRAFSDLRKLFLKERPEVVHLNSSKAAALGALAARLTGVQRVIFTAHGWAFNEDRPWWQRVMLRLASTSMVLLSHKTICVSDAVRKDIASWVVPRTKLVVVHNGISTPAFLSKSAARETLLPGEARDSYWIGVLAELHRTKRIQDALTAFAAIVQTHKKTLMVVLGEGEERFRLENLARSLGIAEYVKFLGFVKDAPTLLRAFDTLVLCSRSEAFPYAILEAGAANVPVIATRVGGIPEIIENGVSGTLVPPFTPHALAKALEHYLTRPRETAHMAAVLHDTVLDRFSIRTMIEKTLALYS